MKKLRSTLLMLFIALVAVAFKADEHLLKSNTGHVWFYSHTAVEDIEAHNKSVSSMLNKKTGDMAFSMFIKNFNFDKAKMQEHFNENYMESDKYPKSTFTGKIMDISQVNFAKAGKYSVEVEGDLTLHGVTNKVSAPGTIEVSDKMIKTNSKFEIALKDYKIEVPTAVNKKIAENIDIHVDVDYPRK